MHVQSIEAPRSGVSCFCDIFVERPLVSLSMFFFRIANKSAHAAFLYTPQQYQSAEEDTKSTSLHTGGGSINSSALLLERFERLAGMKELPRRSIRCMKRLGPYLFCHCYGESYSTPGGSPAVHRRAEVSPYQPYLHRITSHHPLRLASGPTWLARSSQRKGPRPATLLLKMNRTGT